MPMFHQDSPQLKLLDLTPEQVKKYKQKKEKEKKAANAYYKAANRHALFQSVYPVVAATGRFFSKKLNIQRAWDIVDDIIAQAPVPPKGVSVYVNAASYCGAPPEE